MISKLLASRTAGQNGTDYLDSLRQDGWYQNGFARISGAAPAGDPAPQSAIGPVPQNAVPPAISLTTSGTAYTQNFDTLSNTAGSTTNTLTPNGWTFDEAGLGARDNEQYAVDTGGSTTGDTFSYGAAASTERAFGQLRSGTLISTIGASFTNNTGGTITSLAISYDGEQWRFGGVHSTVADKMDFQISFDATSLTTGTWIDVNTLDFSPPVTTGTAGALDGNLAANHVSIANTISSLTIAAGATFWIRWVDTDATSSDDGLAIDNFSITPTVAGGGGETQTVQFNPTSVTQNEGDSGTTAYTFTVTRTGGSTGQVNFSGTIAAGTTDNADYAGGTAPTIFSGSIPAGQTSATVTVNIAGDLTIESNESFTLTLTGATNTDGTVTTNLGAATGATGNITNDDAAGTFNVDDVSVLEGDSGTTVGHFTLHRASGVSGAVTVDYTISLPGGAGNADGFDISGPLTGTVSFAEGETSKTIDFTVNGDVINEPDETFTVTLSNATGGASIGDGTAVGTITNDDAPPAVSIGDATVAEGNNGVSYMTFTVTLNKAAAGAVTVDYATAGNTALAGSDFLDVAGQVTFAAGETSKTVSVPLIGDTSPELNETLVVNLSNVTGGATIADAQGAGTITNDDGNLYYSLAAGSFSQNWTSTGQITTNDNWSGVPYVIGYLGDIDPSGATTSVDPRTLTAANLGAIDVIANQTNPNTNTSGGVAEFDGIANPTIALQGSGTADAPSLVLYMDATGRSDVRLQANLRDIDGSVDNSAQQINVQYRTDPNGAWTNVPGAYFPDATTGPSLATNVTALDVTLPAGANNAGTLEIRIMTTNAAGNDEWVGIDDIVVSSQVSAPSLSIANAAVFEGDSGATLITFTVTRAGSSSGAVTADYSVGFGSGPFDANTADFTPATPLSGQVSFADGQTTATITLSVNGDTGPEGDENFTVMLTNPSAGATIADGSATGTIVNDDGQPPLVTINDVSIVEGDSGTSLMSFTVTRTGGTGAFDVDWHTADGSATAGQDYVAASGTVHFADGQMSDTVTVAVTVNGDTDSELSETLQIVLTNATNFAVITDGSGIGTIASDDPIYIHDIQGTAYFSPILAGEGISSFNVASAGTVIVRAVVTAVDNDGPRQGFYLQEELADFDGNPFTSEGIFVFTGATVSGVAVGDLVTVTAHVMEYQGFASNMPVTTLTNPSSIVFNSSGNPLPTVTLGSMPTAIMTLVQPDYTDSSDGAGDTFDASLYALSYWETVEGMLVTLPNAVVADGFVSTSGGQPIFQAYSASLTDSDQINSRGGLTIAGDPPIGPPDTAETVDDTTNGGRALTDGDINPDIVEIDFSGFAIDAPAGLANSLSMGDELGNITGIVEFDFTDRKLFVTNWDSSQFVDHTTGQETTTLGGDDRSLTFAAFNVENLDPTDPLSKFQGLAQAIATNLHMPDIISIEEIQDNNGAAAGDGTSPTGTDASTTWQMLVDALNTLTGAHYQWVDELPTYNAEGGEQSGNIRVGFLYNTDRVQLGDLDANATIQERREFTDRIGDGVRDAGDRIAFDDSMLGSEIQTSDWAGTRRSLLGQFSFHGNTIFIAANHLPAKGGSDDFWQFNQNPGAGEPTNSGWTQRNAVAQDVYSMLNLIEQGAPGSGIISGGDYNDFYFYRPLTTVTGYTMADGTARVGGARFDNLTLTLSEAERYTYNFDGRSQAIDHVIVNSTLSAIATYDVVHLNTGFNTNDPTPLSDHDPGLSSFSFRNGAERLTGTPGADTIDGGGGNDTLLGGGGNDFLSGGTGNDIVLGEDGNDHLSGGDGDDAIGGGIGADTVYGDDGNDVVTGDAGNDYIEGGAGNDQLYGRDDNDVLVGGAGNDFLDGGDGDDFIAGGDGDDRIYGVAGNDTIEGGAGNETMYGGLGNDTLHGQDGDDYVDGEDGDDLITGGAGADVLVGGAGNDHFYAGTENDYVAGGDGADVAYGESGDDILYGQDGSDYLDAGDGNDLLVGGDGADVLVGGAGNDLLIGGASSDYLHGGAGADLFAFIDALGASNVDTIADFVSGTDRILLDDAVFTALGVGPLGVNAFVVGTSAQDADDRIIYNQATGALYYDADGNGAGAAVQFATIDNHPVVTAGDFTVI